MATNRNKNNNNEEVVDLTIDSDASSCEPIGVEISVDLVDLAIDDGNYDDGFADDNDYFGENKCFEFEALSSRAGATQQKQQSIENRREGVNLFHSLQDDHDKVKKSRQQRRKTKQSSSSEKIMPKHGSIVKSAATVKATVDSNTTMNEKTVAAASEKQRHSRTTTQRYHPNSIQQKTGQLHAGDSPTKIQHFDAKASDDERYYFEEQWKHREERNPTVLWSYNNNHNNKERNDDFAFPNKEENNTNKKFNNNSRLKAIPLIATATSKRKRAGSDAQNNSSSGTRKPGMIASANTLSGATTMKVNRTMTQEHQRMHSNKSGQTNINRPPSSQQLMHRSRNSQDASMYYQKVHRNKIILRNNHQYQQKTIVRHSKSQVKKHCPSSRDSQHEALATTTTIQQKMKSRPCSREAAAPSYKKMNDKTMQKSYHQEVVQKKPVWNSKSQVEKHCASSKYSQQEIPIIQQKMNRGIIQLKHFNSARVLHSHSQQQQKQEQQQQRQEEESSSIQIQQQKQKITNRREGGRKVFVNNANNNIKNMVCPEENDDDGQKDEDTKLLGIGENSELEKQKDGELKANKNFIFASKEEKQEPSTGRQHIRDYKDMNSQPHNRSNSNYFYHHPSQLNHETITNGGQQLFQGSDQCRKRPWHRRDDQQDYYHNSPQHRFDPRRKRQHFHHPNFNRYENNSYNNNNNTNGSRRPNNRRWQHHQPNYYPNRHSYYQRPPFSTCESEEHFRHSSHSNQNLSIVARDDDERHSSEAIGRHNYDIRHGQTIGQHNQNIDEGVCLNHQAPLPTDYQEEVINDGINKARIIQQHDSSAQRKNEMTEKKQNNSMQNPVRAGTNLSINFTGVNSAPHKGKQRGNIDDSEKTKYISNIDEYVRNKETLHNTADHFEPEAPNISRSTNELKEYRSIKQERRDNCHFEKQLSHQHSHHRSFKDYSTTSKSKDGGETIHSLKERTKSDDTNKMTTTRPVRSISEDSASTITSSQMPLQKCSPENDNIFASNKCKPPLIDGVVRAKYCIPQLEDSNGLKKRARVMSLDPVDETHPKERNQDDLQQKELEMIKVEHSEKNRIHNPLIVWNGHLPKCIKKSQNSEGVLDDGCGPENFKTNITAMHIGQSLISDQSLDSKHDVDCEIFTDFVTDGNASGQSNNSSNKEDESVVNCSSRFEATVTKKAIELEIEETVMTQYTANAASPKHTLLQNENDSPEENGVENMKSTPHQPLSPDTKKSAKDEAKTLENVVIKQEFVHDASTITTRTIEDKIVLGQERKMPIDSEKLQNSNTSKASSACGGIESNEISNKVLKKWINGNSSVKVEENHRGRENEISSPMDAKETLNFNNNSLSKEISVVFQREQETIRGIEAEGCKIFANPVADLARTTKTFAGNLRPLSEEKQQNIGLDMKEKVKARRINDVQLSSRKRGNEGMGHSDQPSSCKRNETIMNSCKTGGFHSYSEAAMELNDHEKQVQSFDTDATQAVTGEFFPEDFTKRSIGTLVGRTCHTKQEEKNDTELGIGNNSDISYQSNFHGNHPKNEEFKKSNTLSCSYDKYGRFVRNKVIVDQFVTSGSNGSKMPIKEKEGSRCFKAKIAQQEGIKDLTGEVGASTCHSDEFCPQDGNAPLENRKSPPYDSNVVFFANGPNEATANPNCESTEDMHFLKHKDGINPNGDALLERDACSRISIKCENNRRNENISKAPNIIQTKDRKHVESQESHPFDLTMLVDERSKNLSHNVCLQNEDCDLVFMATTSVKDIDVKNNHNKQRKNKIIWCGEPDEPLEGGWPPGWRKEKRQRSVQKDGKSRSDNYWFSPSNKMFRSMPEVRRHFEGLKRIGGDSTKSPSRPLQTGSDDNTSEEKHDCGQLQREEPTTAQNESPGYDSITIESNDFRDSLKHEDWEAKEKNSTGLHQKKVQSTLSMPELVVGGTTRSATSNSEAPAELTQVTFDSNRQQNKDSTGAFSGISDKIEAQTKSNDKREVATSVLQEKVRTSDARFCSKDVKNSKSEFLQKQYGDANSSKYDLNSNLRVGCNSDNLLRQNSKVNVEVVPDNSDTIESQTKVKSNNNKKHTLPGDNEIPREETNTLFSARNLARFKTEKPKKKVGVVNSRRSHPDADTHVDFNQHSDGLLCRRKKDNADVLSNVSSTIEPKTEVESFRKKQIAISDNEISRKGTARTTDTHFCPKNATDSKENTKNKIRAVSSRRPHGDSEASTESNQSSDGLLSQHKNDNADVLSNMIDTTEPQTEVESYRKGHSATSDTNISLEEKLKKSIRQSCSKDLTELPSEKQIKRNTKILSDDPDTEETLAKSDNSNKSATRENKILPQGKTGKTNEESCSKDAIEFHSEKLKKKRGVASERKSHLAPGVVIVKKLPLIFASAKFSKKFRKRAGYLCSFLMDKNQTGFIIFDSVKNAMKTIANCRNIKHLCESKIELISIYDSRIDVVRDQVTSITGTIKPNPAAKGCLVKSKSDEVKQANENKNVKIESSNEQNKQRTGIDSAKQTERPTNNAGYSQSLSHMDSKGDHDHDLHDCEKSERVEYSTARTESIRCNFIIIESDDEGDLSNPKSFVFKKKKLGGTGGQSNKRNHKQTSQYPRFFPRSQQKKAHQQKCTKSNAQGPRSSTYSFGFQSQKDAKELQDRLFREAAERVRSHLSKPQVFVESGPPEFFVPELNVAKQYPDHWTWPDPYACLGLPAGSPAKLIKTHYRKLALLYHPDKAKVLNPSEKFHGITTAYKKLIS